MLLGLLLVACSVNSPVATTGFLRPNLLRFSRRVWCAWGLKKHLPQSAKQRKDFSLGCLPAPCVENEKRENPSLVTSFSTKARIVGQEISCVGQETFCGTIRVLEKLLQSFSQRHPEEM